MLCRELDISWWLTCSLPSTKLRWMNVTSMRLHSQLPLGCLNSSGCPLSCAMRPLHSRGSCSRFSMGIFFGPPCLPWWYNHLLQNCWRAHHKTGKGVPEAPSVWSENRTEEVYVFQTKVSHLGHTISAEGIGTDPEKTSVVKDWPIPTTVQELRSFLGLASYYRRFFKGFASIAAHCTKLLVSVLIPPKARRVDVDLVQYLSLLCCLLNAMKPSEIWKNLCVQHLYWV